MKCSKPVVDYRQIRFRGPGSENYQHLKWLLYWPIYGLMFLFVERIYPVTFYHPVHCRLDDLIPFNEWFLIPYLFWFVSLVATTLYTLLYDTEAFRRYMKYTALTYTAAIVIYLIYPTCQGMRPAVFARDNLLTRMMGILYRVDTNTNVCPSIHVIGALGVLFATLRTALCRTALRKAISLVCAVLVCASTVFLKQHSMMDVLAALPISLIGYLICFRKETAQTQV